MLFGRGARVELRIRAVSVGRGDRVRLRIRAVLLGIGDRVGLRIRAVSVGRGDRVGRDANPSSTLGGIIWNLGRFSGVSKHWRG